MPEFMHEQEVQGAPALPPQQERERLMEARRRHLSAVADIERRLGLRPRHVRCRECGSIVDTRARHAGRG
jgi:hypothetical protein